MKVLLFVACAVLIGFSIAKGGRIQANLVLLMCGGVLALLLWGCAPPPRIPTETFAADGCAFSDTGESRTRTERGRCIARTGATRDTHGNSHAGNCIAWSRNTIHEKMQTVTCSKQRWVRR